MATTRLWGHPGFRRYFANTSWLMAERVVRLGVMFLVGIYVARYLGPGRFGILNYTVSFVGLFAAFANLGLDGIVVRELVKGEARRDELLGTAFYLKLGGSLLVLLLLAVAVEFTNNTPQETLFLFIIATGLVFQSAFVIDFYFQSQIQSRYVVQAQLLQMAISSAAKLTLVSFKAPLLWFVVVATVDHATLALGLVLNYLRNRHSIRNWRFRGETAKALLRDSWPLIFSGLAVSIYMKIDQVMIKQMLDAEAVGKYAAAVRISEICYLVPVLIATSLFPALIKSKEMGEQVYQDRLQKYYDLNAMLAYILSLPASLLSPLIVSILYGNAYTGAETILSIHIWACPFVFLGVARGKYLINEGMMKFSLWCAIMGAISNIGLNLVLIPKYQGVGAAIATLISQFLSTYVSSFFIWPLYKNGAMQSKALIIPIRLLFKFK